MFDFLKKSRAIRFLCSACLLCSLGLFATFAEDTSDDGANEPATVGTLYYRANLGMTDKHIMLDEARATIDAKMSGTLKYYTETTTDLYSKGQEKGKTLDYVWEQIKLIEDDNERFSILQFAGYDYDGSIKAPDGTVYEAVAPAWSHFLRTATTWQRIVAAEQSYWVKEQFLEKNYATIENPDENSSLALFLTLEDDYKAATGKIDLTGKNFSLSDVQFYEATDATVVEDESAATKFSGPPGKYDIKAIVTKEGSTSIINGPVAKSSDES